MKYTTNNNALVAKCSSHAFINVYNKKLVKKYIICMYAHN